jgi:hypothetical protein
VIGIVFLLALGGRCMPPEGTTFRSVNRFGGGWGFWSFVYPVMRRVMEQILWCWRSDDAKEIELLVPRHELEILRRQHPRPRLEPGNRPRLAAVQRAAAPASLAGVRGHPADAARGHRRMLRRR